MTKDDIVKLKDFIEEQSSLIKNLSKITTLEEKVNSSQQT